MNKQTIKLRRKRSWKALCGRIIRRGVIRISVYDTHDNMIIKTLNQDIIKEKAEEVLDEEDIW